MNTLHIVRFVSLTLLAFWAQRVFAQSSSLQIHCPSNITHQVCGTSSSAVVRFAPPSTTSSCPANATVICPR